MTPGAESGHVERLAEVMTEERVVPVARMTDEGGEPLVREFESQLARGALPHATLRALAVDEQAIHVADDGGGTCDEPSRADHVRVRPARVARSVIPLLLRMCRMKTSEPGNLSEVRWIGLGSVTSGRSGGSFDKVPLYHYSGTL